MGLDFIRKAAPAFHKGLDQSRVALNTPDFFKQEPTRQPRLYAAMIRKGRQLKVGDEVCVRFQAGNVIALMGMDLVADFIEPPEELAQALQASYGEACGIVQSVYDLADTVEITVC